jgi:hypothetical protein
MSSAYAVCLSGHLRSFWTLRHNFEAALVIPNRADVYIHVYSTSTANEELVLQWLRAKPWVHGLEVEWLDGDQLGTIISGFPGFDVLNASMPKAAAIKDASKWRKVLRADEMRRRAELQRGWPYMGVVRTRPDIGFGAVVELECLSLPAQGAVLYTAHPPAATGAVWRFCAGWDGVNGGLCGQIPQTGCMDSPMLHDPQTAVLVECPGCNAFHNPSLKEFVGSCNKFTLYGRGETWGGTHLQDQFAIGTSQAMTVYASLHDYAAGHIAHQPEILHGWRPQMVFGWDPSAATRFHGEPGFLTERLLARHVASANVSVRILETVQWGTHRVNPSTPRSVLKYGSSCSSRNPASLSVGNLTTAHARRDHQHKSTCTLVFFYNGHDAISNRSGRVGPSSSDLLAGLGSSRLLARTSYSSYLTSSMLQLADRLAMGSSPRCQTEDPIRASDFVLHVAPPSVLMQGNHAQLRVTAESWANLCDEWSVALTAFASRHRLTWLSSHNVDEHSIIFWARLPIGLAVANYCEREACIRRLGRTLGRTHRAFRLRKPQLLGPLRDVTGGTLTVLPRKRLVENLRRGAFNVSFNLTVGLFAMLWYV